MNVQAKFEEEAWPERSERWEMGMYYGFNNRK